MLITDDLILLQAGGSGSGMAQLIFFGAMLAIFWLFMIRPQAKRQREQNSFSTSLQKGDEVVTASGIIGKINKLEDNVVVLEVGGKTFIPVTRSSINKEMTDAYFKAQSEDK